MKLRLVLPTFTLLLIGAMIAAADDIHLLNGRVYRVSSWRIEGDNLVMTLPDGRSVTVNRASVLRIDVGAQAEKVEVTSPAHMPEPDSPAAILDIPIPEAALAPLDRGNIAAALTAVDTADDSYRLSTAGILLRGSLLARAGFFAEAAATLGAVAEVEDQYPGARYTRAQALLMQGTWDDARGLFESLAVRPELGEMSDAARSRLALIDQFAGRSLREGDNILVIAEDPALADRVLALATEALAYLATALQCDPPQRMLVVVETNPPPGADTHDGRFDGIVRISARAAADAQAEQLLTHEMTHALLLPRTRGNAPFWLHEGLACHLSGQSLAAGASAPSEASYREALGLVEYLLAEQGEAKLQALLDALAIGREDHEAVQAVYGAPVEELRRRRDLWLGTR